MTKIEWTHRPGTTGVTWNPITGCTPISEGCKHCYAERMAKRLAGRHGYPKAPHEFDVTLHPDKLDQPLHWRNPRTVFVASMGDIFHDDVPDRYIEKVWQIMHRASKHTFMILTKRPKRMLAIVSRFQNAIHESVILPNVWLGVTAENQQRADERIPLLLQCPAAVRFVSVEPMLEPVDLVRSIFRPGLWDRIHPDHNCTLAPSLLNSGIHQVIVGGESGPGARPMHPDWARQIRNQCQAAGIPYFFKQWGSSDMPGDWWLDAQCAGWNLHEPKGGHLLDGKEWRQFPNA